MRPPVAIILTAACALHAAGLDRAVSLDALRNNLPPLRFDADTSYGPAVHTYFRRYGLDFPAKHHFGAIACDTFVIAAHVWIPANCRGTAFLLHSYYDHTGYLARLIDTCLRNRYAAAAIDLPGHGLSSGPRASIDDFSRYARALGCLLHACSTHLPRPYVLIGHSTGCAAAFEYLCTKRDNSFREAIFFAPLVKGALFGLARAGNAILPAFSTRWPRWYRTCSHDKLFLRFQRTDPLCVSFFPSAWARAYFRWFRRIGNYEPIDVPVAVVQGSADESLDWRYNLDFLRKKCLHLETHVIAGAKHHLINESSPYLGRVLRIMTDLLNAAAESPRQPAGDSIGVRHSR